MRWPNRPSRKRPLERAGIICFPECYVPGYRGMGKQVPPADPVFLERAWSSVAAAAARANTRGRSRDRADCRCCSVHHRPGHRSRRDHRRFPGQGAARSLRGGNLFARFGAARFPDRPAHLWRRHLPRGLALSGDGPLGRAAAARRSCSTRTSTKPSPAGTVPTTFADPANTFHEKAALCRAAENTCFFATVNCASAGSPTTSAVVRPDGSLLAYQPYGKPGLSDRRHRSLRGHGPACCALPIMKTRLPVRRRVHRFAARGRAKYPHRSAERHPQGRSGSRGIDLVSDTDVQAARGPAALLRRLEAALFALPGDREYRRGIAGRACAVRDQQGNHPLSRSPSPSP